MLVMTRHVDANLQVLRKLFPGTLLCHDVCALTSLPKVYLVLCLYPDARHQIVYLQATCQTQETELLAAGFPCIDVSRAGLRAGLQGKVCCLSHSCTMLSNAPMPFV